MGFSYCNGESRKWEEVGVIHIAPSVEPLLASDFGLNPVLMDVSMETATLLEEMTGTDPTLPDRPKQVEDPLEAETKV